MVAQGGEKASRSEFGPGPLFLFRLPPLATRAVLDRTCGSSRRPHPLTALAVPCFGSDLFAVPDGPRARAGAVCSAAQQAFATVGFYAYVPSLVWAFFFLPPLFCGTAAVRRCRRDLLTGI